VQEYTIYFVFDPLESIHSLVNVEPWNRILLSITSTVKTISTMIKNEIQKHVIDGDDWSTHMYLFVVYESNVLHFVHLAYFFKNNFSL